MHQVPSSLIYLYITDLYPVNIVENPLVTVNASVRGNWPPKSYLAQIFQSPEQMLWKFIILCISTLTGRSSSYLIC